jgi:hypothetical protein
MGVFYGTFEAQEILYAVVLRFITFTELNAGVVQYHSTSEMRLLFSI